MVMFLSVAASFGLSLIVCAEPASGAALNHC